MTVENILTHGLKTSALGSNYKTEYDENLTLLDKNRLTVGTFASRPAAGTAERFYFASDSKALYYDNGVSWVAVSDTAKGVTNGDGHDHSGGDGAQVNHAGLSNIGTNSHAQVDAHLADGTKHFFLLDEDDMASDSSAKAPSQQSVKAFANLARKNLIINGNPLVNQRAYESTIVTTGANQYTLDRWRVVTSGQALTFSTTDNVVTMTLPIGGIEQVIEGLNIQSGTYVISFTATGDTVCTVDGVTKASGDTFTLVGGTDATVKFSSAGGAGTVKLIQVEAGSVATSFEHRPYGQELALCQRYYWRYGGVQYQAINGWTSSTTKGSCLLSHPVPMRTDTYSTAITIANWRYQTGGGALTLSGITYKKSITEIEIQPTVAGATANNAGGFYPNVNGEYLELNAEL